jgi:hypothetical protein
MLVCPDTLQVIKSLDGNDAAAHDDYYFDSLYADYSTAKREIPAPRQQVGDRRAREARHHATLVEKSESWL